MEQESFTTPAKGNTGKKKENVNQRSLTTPVDFIIDQKENYLNKSTLEESSSKVPAEDLYRIQILKN